MRRFRCKLSKYVVGLCCASFILAFFQYGRLDPKTPYVTKFKRKISTDSITIGSKGRKTILFWDVKDTKPTNATFSVEKDCAGKCDFTYNKTSITASDAVVFDDITWLWPDNWSIGTRRTIKFPEYRRSDQVWIVGNMEPPSNLFGDVRVFDGLFNWTSWYRSDATLYKPYGFPHRLSEQDILKAKDAFKGRNYYTEKTKEITGMVSNCNDQGQRYLLIYKLQKYLKIDMFGKCYKAACGDTAQYSTCDHVTKHYKFYLAFESSRCKDYVTEKYWGAIDRNQIPIVNWKHVDKSLVIPNSYINVYDFKTLKDLAKHLTTVSNDEHLYNSYFEWKTAYRNHMDSHACIICRALHSNMQTQVISSLSGWVDDDICPKVQLWNKNYNIIRASWFWTFGI